MANYIQEKTNANETIRLNFICTHNSRRSHLSQIWAQTIAFHFGIKNIFCYSGGTEATAMFPKVAETFMDKGFQIEKLGEANNLVYAIKYDANEVAVICFSKKYNDKFNRKNRLVPLRLATMLMKNAILYLGRTRIPIKYETKKNQM